jgi:hypothetical protein
LTSTTFPEPLAASRSVMLPAGNEKLMLKQRSVRLGSLSNQRLIRDGRQESGVAMARL